MRRGFAALFLLVLAVCLVTLVWGLTLVEPGLGMARAEDSTPTPTPELGQISVDAAGLWNIGHLGPAIGTCYESMDQSDDEGRIFHESTATNNDATGTWTYTGAVIGPNITATVTDTSGNTSEFSAPVAYSPDADGDGVPDALDNCPLAYNPDQANTDHAPIDNGPDVPNTDVSIPSSDDMGDVCDPDIDNDWMLNTGTSPLGVPGEDVGCNGSGPTNPLVADSDGDTVLDGAECLLGTNPNNPASKPSGIPPGDNDRDGLPAALDVVFCDADYDGDTLVGDADQDCDNDGLVDGLEVKGWDTLPGTTDSDGDGCDDDKEVADINGDHIVSILDPYLVARMVFWIVPTHPIADLNKDGAYTVLDALLAARNSVLLEDQDESSCYSPGESEVCPGHDHTVALLVDPAVSGDVRSALSQFESDLCNEGYSVVEKRAEFAAPPDLRGYLAGLYVRTGQRLAGAILIGDLPYAYQWFPITYTNPDIPPWSEEVISFQYYADPAHKSLHSDS